MKKIITIFFFSILSIGLHKAQAQSSITIDTVFIDSNITINSCVKSWHSISIGVDLTGYSVGDSVKMYVNWGGGISDSGSFRITNWSGPLQSWGYFSHYFTSPGSYQPQVIVVAPDGKRDTALSSNVLNISVCGNISGNVYADANGNCVKDAGESNFPWATVILVNNATSSTYYARSDNSGNYSAYVPATGTYTVTVNSWRFSQYCPTGGHTSVSVPSNGIDFGIDCGNGFDLIPRLTGIALRTGRNRTYRAYAYNTTCNSQSGKLKIVLSDSRISYNPPSPPVSWHDVPNSVSGDTLIFNFTNVDYLNRERFVFPIYTDTTAQIGDTICVTTIIEPISGDNVPSNNIRTYCLPVRNSYDPNNKLGDPLGQGPDKIIQKNTDITYTINFQNTGNDTAYHVVLIDTLSDHLNWSTLDIMDASHPHDFYLSEDGRMKFDFSGINLPDSSTNVNESMGYVMFSISQDQDLPVGTKIDNTAFIFFDYNEAIVTNTVSYEVGEELVGLANNEGYFEGDFRIYPNPSKDILWVEASANNNAQVNLYNMLGELKFQSRYSGQRMEIDTKDLSNGVYFIEILDEERHVKKLIIRH